MQDLSGKEILQILKDARKYKQDRAKDGSSGELKGKTVALIFEKPSTRTRVSFEVGIGEMGGSPIFLSSQELQLSRGETIADTARTLSRYVHGLVARVKAHDNLEELAKQSTVPVINALSSLEHPCQTLADLLTISENKGKLEGIKVAWVGDGNNVCNSFLLGCSLVGMNVVAACPKDYEPPAEIVGQARANALKSGARVEISNMPGEAVKDADVVYTDVFVSMGMEEEREKRMKAFLPTYQVNKKLLKHAKSDVIVLHCLPWKLGQEISKDVAYSPQCVAFDQAENRLHAAKAVLAFLL